MECTSLQKHVDQLNKLCRICSNFISKKQGYTNPKNVTEFADTISKAYNVDAVIEDPNIFPKYLCSICRSKLQALCSKPIDKSYIPAIFREHNDSCFICPSTSGVVTHLKLCDLSFPENGFVTYRGSSSYRRIYVRQRLKECIVNDIEVYVHDDYNFHVFVLGRKIESSQCLKDLPGKINDENVRDLAEYLGNLLICKELDNFEDVLNEKLDISQPFLNVKGEVPACLEDRDGQQCKFSNYKLIYYVICEIFTMSEMKTCTKCKTYASTLRKRRSRMDEDSERKKLRVVTSTANYRFLTKGELKERLNNTQKDKQKSIQRVMRLTLSVNNQIINEGVKETKSNILP